MTDRFDMTAGHQPKPGPVPAARLLPPLPVRKGGVGQNRPATGMPVVPPTVTIRSSVMTTAGGGNMPDRFDVLASEWMGIRWPADVAVGTLAALLRSEHEAARKLSREIADDLARLVREQGRDLEILRREALALREARA